MRHVGMQGFVEATEDATKAAAAFAAAIRDVPELALCGDPRITTVAFKSIKTTVPIFKVSQRLHCPTLLYVTCVKHLDFGGVRL